MKLPKKNIFFIVFLLFHCHFYGQDYSAVDKTVDNYPDANLTLEHLVKSIQKDFQSDEERARAIFRWITTHIEFDVVLAERMGFQSVKAFSYSNEADKLTKEKKFKNELIKQTFVTRKTVCHGYAILFEFLCEALKIESEVIIGTLKSDPSEIGVNAFIVNHAWNVVKINGKWQFVDTTLAAGFISENTGRFKFEFSDCYFLTEPELFFLHHFPVNVKWLLVAKTKTDFIKLPFYHRAYFNYRYRISGIQSGIVPVNTKNLLFKVEGVDEYDMLSYQFSEDGKEKEVLLPDNEKNFNIPIDVKSGFMTLFINNRIILTLKIKE